MISGIVVLDFDSQDAIQNAKREGLPRGPTVKTARGEHRYFKHPGVEVKSRAGIRAGVDVRGDGGLATLPPSIHETGAQYEWIRGLSEDLPELPPDWIALLRGPSPTRSAANGIHNTKAYADAVTRAELAELASSKEGTRNATLNKVAFRFGQLVQGEFLTETEAVVQLVKAASGCGLATESLDEVLHTIHSGMTAGLGNNGRDTSDAFQLLSLEELDALPDPEFLIDGVLPCDALAELFGTSNIGKTFAALDMGLSIAAGIPWLGREVKQGPVVYVYAEGQGAVKLRVKAWREHRKLKPEQFKFILKPVALTERAETKRLIGAIRQHSGPPKLVVMDTLARCFGSGDENLAKDMNAFVANADVIRAAFPGSTVLVVHHSGKDASKGERGSTSLKGATNTVMAMAGTPGRLVISCSKQKDADKFPDLSVELKVVNLSSGGASCVLVARQEKEGEKAAPKAPVLSPALRKSVQAALSVLAKCGPAGATRAEWRQATGRSDSTFKRAKKELLDAKLVEEWNDGTGGRFRAAGVKEGSSELAGAA